MKFTILISLVATIGGFLFGFDSGVINGTVDGLKTTFNSDSVATGFSVASMLLGCAFGAYFAGTMADKIGRRNVLIIASLFFTLSAWGSGIAITSNEFIIYRIIGGLAVGAASVLAPAYISEIAPAKYRGRLSSIQQIAIIVGLTVAFLSNYFIAGKAGGSTNILAGNYEAWRWMFWVELIPAITFFITLLLIPESPRYLVAKGNDNLALKVLTKLFDEDAHNKLNEIKSSLSSNHTPTIKDIIHKKFGLRPIVWIGIGLAIFQQLVGINVIFYYGAVLWQSAGFSESDSLLINVSSGTVSILACLIAIFVIDKIGRKPLLKIGSIGMCITLGIMAIIFTNAALDTDGSLILKENQGLIALISANLYVIFFNASWGPVMWVMLGEMFPNQIRGSGLAISGFAQWISNFLITMTFPILLVTTGLGGAYGIYAIFALISLVFIIKFVKETKGIELEDMKG